MEGHVVRAQDVRRHAGLRVVRVVEDDGGQDGQRQVPGPPAAQRVLVDLVVEEEAEQSAVGLRRHGRCRGLARGCRHFRPLLLRYINLVVLVPCSSS